jgi:hypothetical protein
MLHCLKRGNSLLDTHGDARKINLNHYVRLAEQSDYSR